VTAAPTAAEVAGNLAAVRAEIAAAGVDPGDVEIVAVTKARDAAVVAAALDAGLVDIGENYAQELVGKARSDELSARPDVRWHAIGRLQRNKVRLLVPYVTLWQAVDRQALGVEIARRSPGARVLVQVNISGEPQKGGCPPEDAPALVDGLGGLGLSVEGLMGVAHAAGGDTARREFASLRSLVDRTGLTTCSMGMSDDYREAVAEGATMLRLGTVLVGERPGP
jgi:pyridoxal phosphate enzyme (YggS family)